jgi:pimeloyl-ACP methyl ester carboxylesterase
VQKVLHDFHAARGLVNDDDPKLVIVGHSLGGVISYDILTHFDPTIQVDEFVTVGSQVALFEEMTLYKESRTNLPANPPEDRLESPKNIRRWLNIFDLNDIFGFRVEGVFDGARDFAFETEMGLMEAHGGYFRRPDFYYRLGERLAQS